MNSSYNLSEFESEKVHEPSAGISFETFFSVVNKYHLNFFRCRRRLISMDHLFCIGNQHTKGRSDLKTDQRFQKEDIWSYSDSDRNFENRLFRTKRNTSGNSNFEFFQKMKLEQTVSKKLRKRTQRSNRLFPGNRPWAFYSPTRRAAAGCWLAAEHTTHPRDVGFRDDGKN